MLVRVLDGPRRLRRSLRVARTGATIYFGYRRTQRRMAKAAPDVAAAQWERSHEKAAEALYRLAIDLKGLYVKAGQFLGTRSDVVPAAYVRSLSRLQDRVPPHPAAVIRRIIEEDLGAKVEALFEAFDDAPVAAASLAQVHRARLPGGREVAVKVQYPEVAGLVRLDVRNLRTIVGLVARREPDFDFRAIVNEIGAQVPLELDFRREAEMTQRIAANLADMSAVALPPVIDGMVSKRVLVTGYLEGERLLDGEAGKVRPEGESLAKTIAGAYGRQILRDGLFQADPHPGNILVLPGARVGLLDFGLVKELPDAPRRGFARLVIAAAARDPEGVAAACRELGVKTRSDDPADLMPLMALFFEARPGGGLPVTAIRRNPVDAIPGDLVLLGRVVGLLRGVCASLGTPLTPMQMLRPYAEAALEGEGSA